MKKSKCQCWSCKLSPKIRKFEKSLSASQQKSFREIFEEVWDREEASTMDLNVLEAKIEGSWPKEPGEPYLHGVGKNLYVINSIKFP